MLLGTPERSWEVARSLFSRVMTGIGPVSGDVVGPLVIGDDGQSGAAVVQHESIG
ncbi:hypothetical protein [Arthrobacter pigmenti]